MTQRDAEEGSHACGQIETQAAGVGPLVWWVGRADGTRSDRRERDDGTRAIPEDVHGDGVCGDEVEGHCDRQFDEAACAVGINVHGGRGPVRGVLDGGAIVAEFEQSVEGAIEDLVDPNPAWPQRLISRFEAGDFDDGVEEDEEFASGVSDAAECILGAIVDGAVHTVFDQFLIAEDGAERASEVVAEGGEESLSGRVGAFVATPQFIELSFQRRGPSSSAHDGRGEQQGERDEGERLEHGGFGGRRLRDRALRWRRSPPEPGWSRNLRAVRRVGPPRNRRARAGSCRRRRR